MPGGDRTGPEGKGSMTGRSLGRCSGSGTPGREDDAVPRRGIMGKTGGGRGFRNIFKTTGKTGVERSIENGEEVSPRFGERRGRGFGRGRGAGTSSSGWYGNRKRPGLGSISCDESDSASGDKGR